MGNEKGGGKGSSSARAIADPRFARVQTDPRFMRMPKNRTKVAIDERFAHMFSDKSFADPLGADKRGRARAKKERHTLQRYYKVGDGEEDDGRGADDERGTKGKSIGGNKIGAKGTSKGLSRPRFPGPVAPSKLALEESSDDEESDEEVELEPELKGKGGRKVASKSAEGKRLAEQVRPAFEESAEEEEESGEEILQKAKDVSKQQAKVKGIELPRLKLSAPVVEESYEEEEVDSDEEIDLNSDAEIDLNNDAESEEELEQDVGREFKNRNALIAQPDGDSDEQEDDDEDASSESDDEESSSSSSSSESEPEEELDDARSEEQVPTAPGAETRRIAMMNMDWEHIKAADLLMLMRSFQPKGGHVECVTVYPSEFGIEQINAEQAHGPNMIFEDESDDDDEDKEVNMEKLRAYEKNKLKYYYAVVECDSKETANHLYTQCDGMEFERTSNTLDLRFIPDDMRFVREPRDVAREVQDGYKAPEFETRALQHSTVKLTWDDDEPTRVKALRRKFNADELNEMDFRAYLASESSEEEVDDGDDERPSSPERGDELGANSKKDKYRSLLLGDSAEEPELPGQKKKKGDVDMEVTFHTGLSELSEKLLQRKEAQKRGDETVWEAYLRKKKEKKAQKKRGKNAKGSENDHYSSEEDVASPREADPFFTHDDAGFDDPFFADGAEFPNESKPKSSKEKQSKDESERMKKREEKEQKKKEEERSKAELELLLMDDEGVQGAARGFNLKSKKDKKKKEKGKKKQSGGKEEDDDDQEEDKLATADLTDPRFASLFANHHYAIDPTNPQFRKSAAQLKILAEAQRRRVHKSEDGAATVALNSGNGNAANEGSQDRKRKAELSSLVRSLKRKAAKQ